MWEDPIVAEIHRIRAQQAADCNYDIATYFANVRERQSSQGRGLVRQKGLAEQSVEVDMSRPSGTPGSPSSEPAPAA